MSTCELKILLPRSNRTYAIGERIEGGVEVEAKADCECRSLTLRREWRVEGKGDTAVGGQQQEVLFSGTWVAGQRTVYPFDFVAPPGPVTYHGKILKVAWRLGAHADVAGARDQKVEEEFLLVPGEAPGEADLGPGGQSAGLEMNSLEAKKKGGVVLLISLPIFVITLGACAWLLWRIFGPGIPQDWEQVMLFGAFIAAVLAVTSGGFALATLGHILARKKLGPVDVEFSARTVRPGDTITCRIRLQPQGQSELQEAQLRWWGVEWARRSYQDAHTNDFTHIVFESDTTIAPGQTFRPGQPVMLEGRFQIPRDAPHSFAAPSNKVSWWVAVKLKLRHAPDWSDQFPIIVRP